MVKTNETRKKFEHVQVLRGLAALAVVFVHIPALWTIPGGGSRFFEIGQIGVDVFFVISGFIMVATTTANRPTPGAFFLSRFLRVAPLYWLVTAAVVAVGVLYPSALQATSVSLTRLIKSLFFIPFYRDDGSVAPLLFVGWSLNYEMFFYAIFAACLVISQEKLRLATTISIITALCLFGFIWNPSNIYLDFVTNSLILEFCYGILLGMVVNRIPASPTYRMPYSLMAFASFGLIVFLPMLAPGLPRPLAVGVPAALIVLAALGLDRSVGAAPPRSLVTLGDASYAIYLTHPFVTQICIKVFAAIGGAGTAATFFSCSATLLLVSMVGIATHFLVEKPLNQVARRLLPSR